MTGNDDRYINTNPEYLLGLIAINGLHAVLHLGYGLLGVTRARTDRSARQYMRSGAVLWGLMAAIGWRAVGFESGIHNIMGIALDVWGNIIHTGWFVIGLVFGLQSIDRTTDSRRRERVEVE